MNYMKAKKYSFKEAKKIDLGTKLIYKYPTPTKEFDIGYMIVKGRHPEDSHNFIYEHTCQFVMYIIKGKGKFFVGGDTFSVSARDVVFVPKNTAFAAEGKFEYLTVDVPAFSPEQSEERSHE